MSITSPGGIGYDPPDRLENNSFALLDDDDYPLPGKQRKRSSTEKINHQSKSSKAASTPALYLFGEQESTPIGPRYLVLSRNESNKDKTMEMVSPFLIEKVIQINVGKNAEIKKLRNGTCLIKVDSIKKSNKLCKLTQLTNEIKVKCEEHPRLNNCKGVIYCPDLKYVEDQEIKENIKGVKDVKRIQKTINGQVNKTNLFILTFDTPVLPKEIKVAYMNIKVRPFIPQPLRCYKCQKFGHFTLQCKSEIHICGVCTEEVKNPEIKEKCVKIAKCVNCNENHPSFSKQCLIYKKELNIQTIKTEKRITYFAARKLYLNQLNIPQPFSAIFKDPPINHQSTKETNIKTNEIDKSQIENEPITIVISDNTQNSNILDTNFTTADQTKSQLEKTILTRNQKLKLQKEQHDKSQLSTIYTQSQDLLQNIDMILDA